MSQFGGKDSKRHFTVVMGGKEHGLYVSSTPSSAAKKAVTKLCTANKSKKVEFHIREITQGSKKKTYGPYSGHIEKLKEPIELKGRVIKYKPVAKLSGKSGAKKGGMRGGTTIYKCYTKIPGTKYTFNIERLTPGGHHNQVKTGIPFYTFYKLTIINDSKPKMDGETEVGEIDFNENLSLDRGDFIIYLNDHLSNDYSPLKERNKLSCIFMTKTDWTDRDKDKIGKSNDFIRKFLKIFYVKIKIFFIVLPSFIGLNYYKIIYEIIQNIKSQI